MKVEAVCCVVEDIVPLKSMEYGFGIPIYPILYLLKGYYKGLKVLKGVGGGKGWV